LGYDVRGAVYVGIALVVGMLAREYARAYAADRLGDPTPRRWGWLGPDPRVWIDPFGTIILPVLLLILWASGFPRPPFAYAKPLPFDPSNLRRYPRDVVFVSIAGPAANLLLAIAASAVLRALSGTGGELCVFVYLFALTQLSLMLFHLLPIPGLDGARMLALVMPPRAREVYRNLDQYLVLFVLVIFFLFSAPALSIVQALQNSLMRILAGQASC
jgi:Zn-dependent protease